MSITITIQDGEEYVRKHVPELIQVEHHPAQDGYPEETFEYLPFEANISNGNFCTIWNALGLQWDHCGEVDGQVLLDAVLKTGPEFLVRCLRTEGGNNGGCMIIHVGIDYERALRYLKTLKEIATEAINRGNKKVYWG